MLLLDSEALSAVAQGPAERRDRVRALVAEMRRRERSIGTVAAVLAEVVRGRPSDAAVFAGLRRERIEVRSVLPVEGRPDNWPGLVQPGHERGSGQISHARRLAPLAVDGFDDTARVQSRRGTAW